MSAEVEAYMGRTQAWHALGHTVGREFGRNDIETIEPRLLMDVALVPTYVWVTGERVWDGRYVETPLKGAVVRADGKVVGEGVGKDSYGLVQPRDLLELGDTISGKSGYPLISAGTIREGRQFFFTYDAGQVTPGGLAVDRHLTVCSSHDGTLSAMALNSTTIVVCANTLAAALANASDRLVFKHTSQVQDRIETAIHAIQTEQVHAQLVESEIERLMLIQCSEGMAHNLLNDVLPPKYGKDDVETARSRKARSAIRGLLTSDVTAGFENTGWAFVQAVNTYENWNQPVRGNRSVRQFDAMVKGNQPLTDKAIKRTLALV